MGGMEQKFIQSAFDTNWVVPLGPNVDGFDLEEFLGVQPGDEVICQSFTFSASANPIKYLGASPVFVDSEGETWNMDPGLLEEAIVDRMRVTGRRPKAVIPVHLYGMPAKMGEILEVAGRFGIPVVEDAAYRELYFQEPWSARSVLTLPEWRDFPRLYLSTLTKSFATGLKVGFGLCTDAAWRERMLHVKGHHDFGTANFSQALMEQAIDRGGYERQLAASTCLGT
jgi:DNA-binding transcriptional MocR family regulator